MKLRRPGKAKNELSLQSGVEKQKAGDYLIKNGKAKSELSLQSGVEKQKARTHLPRLGTSRHAGMCEAV